VHLAERLRDRQLGEVAATERDAHQHVPEPLGAGHRAQPGVRERLLAWHLAHVHRAERDAAKDVPERPGRGEAGRPAWPRLGGVVGGPAGAAWRSGGALASAAAARRGTSRRRGRSRGAPSVVTGRVVDAPAGDLDDLLLTPALTLWAGTMAGTDLGSQDRIVGLSWSRLSESNR